MYVRVNIYIEFYTYILKRYMIENTTLFMLRAYLYIYMYAYMAYIKYMSFIYTFIIMHE